MPFKASVLSEVDRVSETARKVGACNTLYWSGGEIVAENTDAVAVETLLAQASDFQRRAVVIGSGGAARAAVAALGGRGYTVVLLARNATTRQNLAREFSCVETSSSQLEEAFTNPVSLIVNATPVGWLSDVSPLDAQFLKPGIAVMDFVFSKSPTRLLRDAAAVGCRVIDGLTILAIQGVRQIELWTDRFMDERDMRGWLEEAIDV
jgi:shikimate dehydrogenase